MSEVESGYNGICYQRNYLTEVIARIDFPGPITALESEMPSAISREVMKLFPIAEPKHVTGQYFQITSGEFKKAQELAFTEWRYHGRDRQKTLAISPNAVWARYTTYSTYEEMKGEFVQALSAFFDTFKDTQGSRLGLRYVNNIGLPNGDPLDWSGYIDERMLSLFGFYPRPDSLARVFHNLEFNFSDFNLRYQFGVHNPDYPATIRRRLFVLDLDAYDQGPQQMHDVPGNLDKFHIAIQELFELSITDGLREKMNE